MIGVFILPCAGLNTIAHTYCKVLVVMSMTQSVTVCLYIYSSPPLLGCVSDMYTLVVALSISYPFIYVTLGYTVVSCPAPFHTHGG